MQNYTCNNCGTSFSLAPSAQVICPSCGSMSVQRVQENNATPLWQQKGVWIPAATLLLMLIILFLLPGSSNHFDLYLEKYPEQCKFKIIVKEGKSVLNADKFRYSLDNGKTWQKQNEFIMEVNGTFTIKVQYRDDSTINPTPQFMNPFAFYPTCPKLTANPCDCKQLQVLSVEPKEINKQPALVIHASQPQCTKEYSIDGLKGRFQPDSIFYIKNAVDFSIFIKTSKCEPVAYAMNPFHIEASSGSKVSAGDLSRQINRFIRSRDNKEMYSIVGLFESPKVKVIVNNNAKDSKNIYQYLQRLKTIATTNPVIVKITKVTYNNSNKINQLALIESQQNE